jgi:hypothetical protein
MLGRRNTVIDPSRASDEISHRSSREIGHFWDDLNSGRAIADNGYSFVRIVVAVVPTSGMRDMAFEIFEARNFRIGWVTGRTSQRLIAWKVFQIRRKGRKELTPGYLHPISKYQSAHLFVLPRVLQ